jgi:NADH dehydrogenase
MSTNHGTQNEQQARPRVVIVGAGFGGLQAALHLRNAPIDLTVIDRTNHHLFQPLLYQVATATLSPGEISAPIRHVLRNQQNTRVIMAEVTGVDKVQQCVLLADHSIPYDYLILATGAKENYFGHDEWHALAPGLKSIEDARAIRHKVLMAFEAAELETDQERIKQLLTFVIVGAGPTGVEMAGAIAEVAHKVLKSDFRHIDPTMARIILVEAAPRILCAFPASLAQTAQHELTRLGVEVKTGAAVSEVDEHGITASGERIIAHTVLWTAGVKASPAWQWLGAPADRARRVQVLSDLSIPHHSNVFVIGDTATFMQDGKPLPGVAPVAMQQGRYVARLISQRVEHPEQSTPAFHYVNKGNLSTVGRAFAIVDLGAIRMAGFLAWVLWLAIHIFYLIGFENRLLVMLRWAMAYLSFQYGVRLITDPEEAATSPAQQAPTAPTGPEQTQASEVSS